MPTKEERKAELEAVADILAVGNFELQPSPVFGVAVYRLAAVRQLSSLAVIPVVFWLLVLDDGGAGEDAFWRSEPPGPLSETFRARVLSAISSRLGNTNPRTGNIIAGARLVFVDDETSTAEVETYEATGANAVTVFRYFVTMDNGNLDIRTIA